MFPCICCNLSFVKVVNFKVCINRAKGSRGDYKFYEISYIQQKPVRTFAQTSFVFKLVTLVTTLIYYLQLLYLFINFE